MRGLNVLVMLAALALVTATVPTVFPGFNNGNGIPMTPGGIAFIDKIGEWQIGALSPQLEFGGGDEPNTLDYAMFMLKLAFALIIWVIGLASVIVIAFPFIMALFPGMPVVFAAIIQMVIYVALFTMLVQLLTNRQWGQNE